MNLMGTSALFYVGIAVGLFYLFYLRMSTVTWDEFERRELFKEELHSGHLLELMEAPDVRQISADRRQRDTLFQGFSAFLLEDVRQLKGRYPMGLSGWCWLGLFYLGYCMVRAKSWIRWGRGDLRFLAGLELALIRSIRRN